MNEKQIEAVRIAQHLNDMSASHHNKCKSLLGALLDYTPERLREALPQLKALLFAVDDYQQKANGQLTAAINDKDYPT